MQLQRRKPIYGLGRKAWPYWAAVLPDAVSENPPHVYAKILQIPPDLIVIPPCFPQLETICISN